MQLKMSRAQPYKIPYYLITCRLCIIQYFPLLTVTFTVCLRCTRTTERETS